ncbi:PREDICTED: zinc finger protein Eos [Sturnus vulgaris]|uniref:zinc finger protein Eos n=1 Tax=Sturnus vulgaris TaxID=9172 RepID=UPI00071AA511|nr:PREDICTED: zinc finger protein Eos [Sturnus vulgaris]
MGEKQMRFALSDLPFDVSPAFEKDSELVPARGHGLEPPYAGPLSLLGAGDPLRPLRLATNCITEVTPVISSVYTQIQALPARLELPRGRDSSEDGAEGIPVIFRSRDAAGSPSNGCQDSTDTESIQEERAGGGSSRHSPAYAKEEPKEEPEGAARCFPKESLRVLNEEGEQLRAFCCEHCRVLFLDHVMFTIHMGCHGFRDPFECNICGYRSQDRYEFSSHIVRGEHKI